MDHGRTADAEQPAVPAGERPQALDNAFDEAGRSAAAGLPDRRPDRLRARLLDKVAEGPRPFYRAALASLAGTSAVAAAVASLVRPAGPLPWPQRTILVGALVTLLLAAALGTASIVASRRPATTVRRRERTGPDERAAGWLALAVWFPLLLVVVRYRCAATIPPADRWVYFPFHDKRWIGTAYLLATVAPSVLLLAARRVLAVGRTRPPTWRAWFAGLFRHVVATAPAPRPRPDDAAGTDGAAGRDGAGAPAARSRRGSRPGLRVAAGLVTAAALAWYLFGPPWYLERTTAPISAQEHVVLIGLQAVERGHLPYVGVAEVQYGPGTQLASYLLMQHVTSFSVVGFREAWAVLQLTGAGLLFAVFFLAYGYVRGLAASLLAALVYPGLANIAFGHGGGFDGYWGWANPLRYVGVVALVLLLPAVVRRSPSLRGAAAGIAVGGLWGVTSYLAQENLLAGAVGALVVCALLLLSRTSPVPAVRAALVATSCGFLLVWLPVLAVYAVHGRLGDFLAQYFLFPVAVASGANNSFWRSSSPLTPLFRTLPVLLTGLALLAVVRLRPLRVATGWSRERIGLATTVLATTLLYQGALLRSDTSHMTGTLLVAPALTVVAATVLPRMLGARTPLTAALVGAAVVVASLALLPARTWTWTSVRTAVAAPWVDRARLGALPPPVTPTTTAGRRVGAGLVSAPVCCPFSQVPMPEFVDLMDRVHTLVGPRTAYVADFQDAYPGLVYFVADLDPAPVSTDKYSSIMTAAGLDAFLTDFRERAVLRTGAVLTTDLAAPEARAFLERYPDARRTTLSYNGRPYYVLVRAG